MANNEGLCFIKHLRTKHTKDLSAKVKESIRWSGTFIFPLGIWMGGVIYSGNHDSLLSNEYGYYLSYMFGLPPLAVAASFGLGQLVGKGIEKLGLLQQRPNEEDKRFLEGYDSLAELVNTNDNFMGTEEFKTLPSEYRDALRIEGLAERLFQRKVDDAQRIRGQLESAESKTYVHCLMGRYLEALPVGDLP